MKKKGFTLIELLAVIVILAILTVIAVPKILDVIEKSERQSYVDGVKLIKSGIKMQLSSNDLTGEGDFEKDQDSCYLFDFTNKNDNYQKLNVKNKENYEGIIKYCDNKFILEEFKNDKYIITTDSETGKEIVGKVEVSSVKKYKITFNDSDGTLIKILKIKEGTKVPKPDDPTKDGYNFVKWVLDGSDYTFTEEVTNDITLTAVWEKKEEKLCKRATTLHTEECTQTDSTQYCSGAGYTAGNKGTTITYGNLGTKGVLASGDAFDCDVNGDGVYDSNTERFYYVSDYYYAKDGTFDSTYATLIYYNNTNNGVADNTKNSATQYGTRATPTIAMSNLPNWSNVELKGIEEEEGKITKKRVIRDNRGNQVNGGFTYDKSTRLITINEINEACPLAFNWVVGELDNCAFLMENTTFSTPESESRVNGFWTENPRTYDYSGSNYIVYSPGRDVEGGSISKVVYGARPAIDVPKKDIDY